nr:hypothetical protein Iba_chr13aCG13170 [Ipomoea batatas]
MAESRIRVWIRFHDNIKNFPVNLPVTVNELPSYKHIANSEVSCHTIPLYSVEAHHIKPRLKTLDKSNKARMLNHVQWVVVHDGHPRNLLAATIRVKSDERCAIWVIIQLITKDCCTGAFGNVAFEMTSASYFTALAQALLHPLPTASIVKNSQTIDFFFLRFLGCISEPLSGVPKLFSCISIGTISLLSIISSDRDCWIEVSMISKSVSPSSLVESATQQLFQYLSNFSCIDFVRPLTNGSSLTAARASSNRIFQASWKNVLVVGIVGAVRRLAVSKISFNCCLSSRNLSSLDSEVLTYFTLSLTLLTASWAKFNASTAILLRVRARQFPTNNWPLRITGKANGNSVAESRIRVWIRFHDDIKNFPVNLPVTVNELPSYKNIANSECLSSPYQTEVEDSGQKQQSLDAQPCALGRT